MDNINIMVYFEANDTVKASCLKLCYCRVYIYCVILFVVKTDWIIKDL